jgi:hypothetical protein
MKNIFILCLFLITTGQALSQNTHINIGSTANGGGGDPLRTMATKLNQNDYNLALSGTATGTDTYLLTIAVPSPGYTTGITAPSSYVTGQVFRVTFTNTNTGAATLNINSIGAKAIKKNGSTALASGDISAGQIVYLVYDGTNLQVVGDGGATTAYVDSQDSGRQPIDGDLTAIAGLSPSNDDIVQRKAGAWTNRTIAQLTTDLNLVADAINDGTTTVAPSQNAVYDGLDLKIAKLITANRQTSSYTLVLGDAVKIVELNSASANNLTVPPNSTVAFPVGTQILIAQYGAGQTTIVAGGGVTLRSDSGKLKIAAQYGGATIVKIATDEWYVFGNLTL